jgi:hypothetical protein
MQSQYREAPRPYTFDDPTSSYTSGHPSHHSSDYQPCLEGRSPSHVIYNIDMSINYTSNYQDALNQVHTTHSNSNNNHSTRAYHSNLGENRRASPWVAPLDQLIHEIRE